MKLGELVELAGLVTGAIGNLVKHRVTITKIHIANWAKKIHIANWAKKIKTGLFKCTKALWSIPLAVVWGTVDAFMFAITDNFVADKNYWGSSNKWCLINPKCYILGACELVIQSIVRPIIAYRLFLKGIFIEDEFVNSKGDLVIVGAELNEDKSDVHKISTVISRSSGKGSHLYFLNKTTTLNVTREGRRFINKNEVIRDIEEDVILSRKYDAETLKLVDVLVSCKVCVAHGIEHNKEGLDIIQDYKRKDIRRPLSEKAYRKCVSEGYSIF